MKSGNAKVTEAEVRQAIEKFQQAGGLIQRLPDQAVPARTVAASNGVFENVEEFLSRIDAGF